MSSEAWRPKTAAPLAGLRAARVARMILPDEMAEVAPMAWRQVGAAAPNLQKPAAAAPDMSAQIQQIQQQYEQKVTEARTAGFREGEAAGRTQGAAQAAAQTQPVIEKLAHSIDELAQIRTRLRRQAEEDTIKLSLAIARRVLRRELAIDPDAMRGLVMAALEKLQAQELCRVRVNPSHVAAITACLRQSLPNSKVEVIPDGSLQPGGAVFETNQGNLDASVDSQLQEIERGLTDCVRRQA